MGLADRMRADGSTKSAKALRFFALTRMLAEAEDAALMGNDIEAAARAASPLREADRHDGAREDRSPKPRGSLKGQR